jgi:hypothetical protein
MSDFATLSCPSCGGKLEITSDTERFACAYCGMEHLARRSEGVITISPIVVEIKTVADHVARTASELAITRLEREIAQLVQEKARVEDTVAQEWSKVEEQRQREYFSKHKSKYFPMAIASGLFLMVLPGLFAEIENTGFIAPYLAVGFSILSVVFITLGLISNKRTRNEFLHREKMSYKLSSEPIATDRRLLKFSQEIQVRQDQLDQHRRNIAG